METDQFIPGHDLQLGNRFVEPSAKQDLLPVVYLYSGCRWDMQPPARHRYLMQALSAHTHVLFLNSPNYSGGLFEYHKPRVERIHDSLTLIHDAQGFRSTRIGKRIGRAAAELDGAWLSRAIRDAGVDEYVYWLATPDPALITGMRADRLVYDCIDPCFTEAERAGFDAAESAVARAASMVFCSAEALADRLTPVNPACHLLPNACEFDEYTPIPGGVNRSPDALLGRRRPVIGFMGTIDWRLDTDAIASAAARLPEFTFAIVGRINADQEPRVARLRSMPNVIMPGAVSREEGHAWTAAFDVGLIPFVPGPMGDAINPVKMYMYLAAGKPVVSTWIRECRNHAPLVLAARDSDEFVAAIGYAVESGGGVDAARRIEFAARNTWKQRAATAAGHLRARGYVSGCRACD